MLKSCCHGNKSVKIRHLSNCFGHKIAHLNPLAEASLLKFSIRIIIIRESQYLRKRHVRRLVNKGEICGGVLQLHAYL